MKLLEEDVEPAPQPIQEVQPSVLAQAQGNPQLEAEYANCLEQEGQALRNQYHELWVQETAQLKARYTEQLSQCLEQENERLKGEYEGNLGNLMQRVNIFQCK